MPLYDYGCNACGPFREWRSMAEWQTSVPCPHCAAPAHRLAAASMVAVLAPNNRIAHERNERSAHEPRVVRRGESFPDHSHQCDVGPLVRQQFGDVQKSGADRPWMLGH